MAKHYYISFNGSDFSEIFPVNNPKATKRQLEGTRAWREEVDELKLTRTNNETVYDTLASYALDKTKFDTELEIEIYSGTRTTGTVYFKGIFSISDEAFNLEYKVFNITPRINDVYLTILEKADIQYELDGPFSSILETTRVGYSQSVSIGTTWTNGTTGGVDPFATLVASGGVISTAIADNPQGAELDINESLALDDIVIIDFTAYTKSAGTDPTIGINYGAGDTSMTDEAAKSVGTGQLAFTISTGQVSPRIILLGGSHTISGTFEVRKVLKANDNVSGGVLLMTFIENYIDSSTHMGIGAYTGNVVSTFFNNDALPTGAPSSITTIMSSEPNGNYVTGTSDNELNSAIIGLLRKWFGIVTSASFKLSFNEIMSQLREIFQVYWFIDADDKFRIEHEMYFVSQVADSTPIVLPASAETDHREYKYNKSRIASIEQFVWAQSENQDFIGKDIIYNNFETIDSSLSHSANYFTTDIKYVIDNLSDASSSGLCLFQCNLLTGITASDMYEIVISTGEISTTAISNAAFSWANLHSKYWSWSRMAEDATVNGVAVTMDSEIRFLEQGSIRWYYSTAIDPFTLITAQLTGGSPIEIQRDLETDFTELIIGFDPYKL